MNKPNTNQDTQDMARFDALIEKVGELPAADREKVAVFVQGFLAGSQRGSLPA